MGDKGRVLIVEDEVVVRTVLSGLLDTAGYACSFASTCAQALELTREPGFACGLIDLGLPDGNGLSLLPDLKRADPWLVPVILTVDARPETIVETLRAGAFDYLMKPFNAAALKAALARAVEHHKAIRERDRLFELLSEEREQLKARVEEATADIRQYAAHCETVNARLHALLRLTQVSADYTDESLFRSVFEELAKYFPIQCVALCSAEGRDFVAALQDGQDVSIIAFDSSSNATHRELPLDGAASSLADYVNRYTGLNVAELSAFAYPQTFWGHTLCSVAFYFPKEYMSDSAVDEFLSMCAHFIASEWQEAQLFLHASTQASLGNIALELSKGFIQGLTAIRTAADVVAETEISPDAAMGVKIICDNVEGVQRQIQEFRQLALLRKGSFKTVCLDEYIDQALEMLSSSVQRQNIELVKEYQSKCPCVVLNVSTLARTFIDLISSAMRTVPSGGRIVLRLKDAEADFAMFEVTYDGADSAPFDGSQAREGRAGPIRDHPQFLLAQRAIRSCGGRLTLEHTNEGPWAFRVLLPKNALNPARMPEAKTP